MSKELKFTNKTRTIENNLQIIYILQSDINSEILSRIVLIIYASLGIQNMEQEQCIHSSKLCSGF